jgi:hypothetical protein
MVEQQRKEIDLVQLRVPRSREDNKSESVCGREAGRRGAVGKYQPGFVIRCIGFVIRCIRDGSGDVCGAHSSIVQCCPARMVGKYGCLVRINRTAGLVVLQRCEQPRLPPTPVWWPGPISVTLWTGSASSRRAFQGWIRTLPAAQRSEATMAAQARVASAVAVTATSARSQEPSGPVKAYQRVPSAVQSAVGSWHKEHTRGTLSKNSLRYASQGLIKWGGIRLGRNRGRVWGVGACGSLADVDDRPVRQVV